MQLQLKRNRGSNKTEEARGGHRKRVGGGHSLVNGTLFGCGFVFRELPWKAKSRAMTREEWFAKRKSIKDVCEFMTYPGNMLHFVTYPPSHSSRQPWTPSWLMHILQNETHSAIHSLEITLGCRSLRLCRLITTRMNC